MNANSNIFTNKKILIYGLGKTGIATSNFLKKRNKIYLFDDKKKDKSKNKILKTKFDVIIISPGINKDKCKLKFLLKKNSNKIYTDFDVFKTFYDNLCITITGTNGKSTTSTLLYQILKEQGYDAKLAGNVGFPILSIKNIKPKTIFVIEASSYQLDYSRIYNSKYSAILNIANDHLERHGTLNNYINAKFKLIINSKLNSIAYLNKNDININNFLKKKKLKTKIIKVNTKSTKKNYIRFKNDYFLTASNKENLLFVLEIIKNFKIKRKKLLKTIENFKGLKYRQQTIYKKNDIEIINDSKSTSYSSSIELLKSSNNIYWLLAGIPKKGDKFILPEHYYKNIKGYVIGKYYKKFQDDLKNKIELKKVF